MHPKIGHIGIVVKDIQLIVLNICTVLNLSIPEIHDNQENNMKFALIDMNGLCLEIIEDYNEDGRFSKFNLAHGNAVHHICVLTDTIEKDIETLKENGVQMLDQKPKIGLRGKKIAFTAEAALNGLTFELSEP